MKKSLIKIISIVLASCMFVISFPTIDVIAKTDLNNKKNVLGNNKSESKTTEIMKKPVSGMAEYNAPEKAKKLTKKEASEKEKLISSYTKKESLLKNDAKFYYYYSILDPVSKEIYDILYDVASDPVDPGNIGLMITELDPYSEEFQDAYNLAYRAMMFDHAELFWLYSGMAYINAGWIKEPVNGLYYIYFGMEEPFEEFEDMMNKFNSAAEDFIKSIDSDLSDYEIIRQVHDELIWMADYNDPVGSTHERSDALAHSAYAILVADSIGNKNSAVCDGYALALEYLLQQFGLDVAFIGGIVDPDSDYPGGHAWNVVKVDGQWYEIDSTWDDFGSGLDDIDDKEVYKLFEDIFEDDNYKDNLEHPYFLISTEHINHFEPGDEYDYVFSDGSYISLMSESVRSRVGERESDYEDYGFADSELIKKAPIAKADFNESNHNSKSSKSNDKKDNRTKYSELDPDDFEMGESGLPIYVVEKFVEEIIKEEVLIDVPDGWGNNDSGRTRISYSPVNDSGAISPLAGTLTLSYFNQTSKDVQEAFDVYINNIASMNMVHNLKSEEYKNFDAPARKINYIMNLGSNIFACTSICFAYDNTIYVIELLQGNQSIFDFMPMYEDIVASANVGDEKAIREAQNKKDEIDDSETEEDEDDDDIELEEKEEDKEDNDENDAHSSTVDFDNIGDFIFKLNGHLYNFPTQIIDMDEHDLPLDYNLVIPYDFDENDDLIDGIWTEIINTQYMYFDDSMYVEMAGITNLKGEDADIRECVLTSLVDTQSSNVEIELPGGVKVGSKEEDIYKGFPKFKNMKLDGVAKFIKNDLLYACNVRDDGCNGYVLIKNNSPFYSAVSIICEEGIVKEICYECLGSERAKGVFLED